MCFWTAVEAIEALAEAVGGGAITIGVFSQSVVRWRVQNTPRTTQDSFALSKIVARGGGEWGGEGMIGLSRRLHGAGR